MGCTSTTQCCVDMMGVRTYTRACASANQHNAGYAGTLVNTVKGSTWLGNSQHQAAPPTVSIAHPVHDSPTSNAACPGSCFALLASKAERSGLLAACQLTLAPAAVPGCQSCAVEGCPPAAAIYQSRMERAAWPHVTLNTLHLPSQEGPRRQSQAPASCNKPPSSRGRRAGAAASAAPCLRSLQASSRLHRCGSSSPRKLYTR